ncbi:MAG: DUF2442 domain-containing protein [Fibrobacterota bacterium]
MYNEIKAFAFIQDKKMYVEFENGKTGLFDMAKFIVSDFFSDLKNEDYFKQAHLEFGVLTWPQGQDISPSTVEAELEPFELSSTIPLIRDDSALA